MPTPKKPVASKTANDVPGTRKKKDVKKKSKSEAASQEGAREASVEDNKNFTEAIAWIDSVGPADDRSAEEKAQHKTITDQFNRNCGERDRRLNAFFTGCIKARMAAIAALPTERLREAALIESNNDQFPLSIPHAALTPPIDGFVPGQRT